MFFEILLFFLLCCHFHPLCKTAVVEKRVYIFILLRYSLWQSLIYQNWHPPQRHSIKTPRKYCWMIYRLKERRSIDNDETSYRSFRFRPKIMSNFRSAPQIRWTEGIAFPLSSVYTECANNTTQYFTRIHLIQNDTLCRTCIVEISEG